MQLENCYQSCRISSSVKQQAYSGGHFLSNTYAGGLLAQMPLLTLLPVLSLNFTELSLFWLYPTCWHIFVPNHKKTCSTLTFQRRNISSFCTASAIRIVTYIIPLSKRPKRRGMDFKTCNNCNKTYYCYHHKAFVAINVTRMGNSN